MRKLMPHALQKFQALMMAQMEPLMKQIRADVAQAVGDDQTDDIKADR
ncbi:MAG TPA: hypothetical protein VH278_15845 [Burkholderiaceae bacterium]|jgi:hypothetical protein|nr:hypothetical protein [Burkholderiaceae bacterium]